MHRNIRNTAAVFCAFLALSGLSAVSSQAYLESRDTAANHFTVGSIDTELVEEFPANPDLSQPFTKKAAVRNTGKNPCYVRMRALPTAEPEQFSFDFNTTDWERDGSGTESWWYYKRALGPGETTPWLFTTVTMTGTVPEGDLSIIVYEEASQAEGYPDAKSAFAN